MKHQVVERWAEGDGTRWVRAWMPTPNGLQLVWTIKALHPAGTFEETNTIFPAQLAAGQEMESFDSPAEVAA